MKTQISAKAADRAITLDELGKLVQEAHRLELPGDTRFKVKLYRFTGLMFEIVTADPLSQMTEK